MVIIKIIRESFLLAFQELYNNKLRSLLSLTGITIGIFCIISVFASVDTLENDIHSSIDEMGDNVVYVEKWPWNFSSEYPWWKYMNRPEANYKDYKGLKKYSDKSRAVAIQVVLMDRLAQFKNNYMEDSDVAGVSFEFNTIYAMDFQSGRFFSAHESESGENVAVIGYDVANTLFPFADYAIGKEIKVMGRKVKVVGVIEKEGESIVGSGLDEVIIMPYNYTIKLINKNSNAIGKRVIVKAKDGVTLPELKDELTMILRNIRGLRPMDDDNFALNQSSIIQQGIEESFSVINFAGGFIGIFSILVGGFGIANIMFVSVKERTRVIGVKLSLGARKVFILLEFLIESTVLCLLGGLMGLLLVYLLFYLLSQAINYTLVVSLNNIILGVGISVAIGLIAGIFPASSAARMDPVEAMRK